MKKNKSHGVRPVSARDVWKKSCAGFSAGCRHYKSPANTGFLSNEKIREYMEGHLSRERYSHTLNVAKLAIMIAKRHGIKNLKKIETAALLHDYSKGSGNGAEHSAMASRAARRVFKIKDRYILDAIRHHTFGHRDMSDFSKIIYIADFSEPGRRFSAAKKIRRAALRDLDRAMLLALSEKIKYVVSKGEPLSGESVALYNKLVNSQCAKK